MPHVAEDCLRIALTSYRSKPFCGGQGVYVRELTAALTGLGHRVEVFSGQPYPDLSGIDARLTTVPGLDLYAEENPFRQPARSEFRDATDVVEYLTMCTAGFPEPRTFARRVAPILLARRDDFDVVHDNQTFGPGLLRVVDAGIPFVATLHHPITVDRRLDLAAAEGFRRVTLRRWYGFLRYQKRVARRVPIIVSPSQNSIDDAVADFGLDPEQLRLVPVGVDLDHFRPRGERVSGRIVAMGSADVPLKGIVVLLRALAALPDEVDAHAVVVSPLTEGGDTERLLHELDLGDRVRFVENLTHDEVADLMASAEIMCVPSLYEGFSLPAVEAMASGCALVASDAGALPEVVGPDGEAGLLVPAGDPGVLAVTLEKLLDQADLRARLGEAARRRAVEHFSWRATASKTVAAYREAIDRASGQC